MFWQCSESNPRFRTHRISTYFWSFTSYLPHFTRIPSLNLIVFSLIMVLSFSFIFSQNLLETVVLSTVSWWTKEVCWWGILCFFHLESLFGWSLNKGLQGSAYLALIVSADELRSKFCSFPWFFFLLRKCFQSGRFGQV